MRIPLVVIFLAACVASPNSASDVSVSISNDELSVAGLPALSDDGHFVLVQTDSTLHEIDVASRTVESEWLIQSVEDGTGEMIAPYGEDLEDAMTAVEARRWSTLDAMTRASDGSFAGHGVHVRVDTPDDPEETVSILEVTTETGTTREPLDGESVTAVYVAPDRSYLLLTLWGCACECGEWPMIVPL